MAKEISIEQAESLVLEQVKFVDFVLEQARKRNEELATGLGMSYGKLVGLGTPFEEVIHSMRKVKKELDGYLKVLREQLLKKYGSQLTSMQQGGRR